MKIINKENGFTLVELAIVILIAGLLIGMFGSFLTNYNTNIKQSKLRNDMELISNSLQRYLEANGKLPCPAAPEYSMNPSDPKSPYFGVEKQSNCLTVTSGDGITVTGGVVIGSLPVRSLNLPDEYIIDPWGGRYTYAVTAELADTSDPYSEGTGQITVKDSASNSIANNSYIIVSHGKNNSGSYTLDGELYSACSSATTLEKENCDNDTTFVNTLINSEDGSNYFDDFTLFQGYSFTTPNIPEGAVMAFDLTACPSGWSKYTNAVGRTIVGTGTTTTITDTASGSPTTASQSQVTYNHGAQGGALQRIDYHSTSDALDNSRYDNRTPYVALLYCRKD